MSNPSNAAASNAGNPRPPYRPTHQFKPFAWVDPNRFANLAQQSQAAFLNDARDIVQGAQALVQLLAWDEDRHEAAASDEDPPPLFDSCQRETLQRFLSAALGLLQTRIEAQCEALAP